MESPSHSIRVEDLREGRGRAPCHARGDADRDFVLKGAGGAFGAARIVEIRADGRTHVLASFRPVFEAAGESAPAEVVFVIDRSGSMDGASIAEARNALQLALRSLRAGTLFNIVGFGDRHEALFPESRPYGEDTLAQAASTSRRWRPTWAVPRSWPALQSC